MSKGLDDFPPDLRSWLEAGLLRGLGAVGVPLHGRGQLCYYIKEDEATMDKQIE
jgi:hypothetical protein